MLLYLPADRDGTEISKVKRLDLEHPSVSAVEGIFTVLITGDIFIPSQPHPQPGYWKDKYNI